MTRTVDLVIVGANAAAIKAAADAASRGLRVLLVIRQPIASLPVEQRKSLRLIRVSSRHRVFIVAGAELACVDGVRTVEAVVVRYVRSCRLTEFNASALLDFEGR